MPADQYDALFHATEEVIFDVIDRHGGSISAEHGIGRIKQAAFLKRADPLTLELSRRIKDALDPDHLLSEGRILASMRAEAEG
ncbi:putative FAD-linked oxidoreductase [compost metagenome]